ncbi:MAG: polymerase sigma factor FliA [Candidatus Atribacteria bacterium]|nr:polymerase sigma factor FliA [Candidatus Atribacteria bacterium]
MNLTPEVENLDKIWERYSKTKDPTEREKLAEHYLYLVKIALGRLLYIIPSYIDREDLESYGVLGLLQALDRYQPKRGLKFETFALSRIRGAALDYLRSLDPLTRQERRNWKEVMAVYQKLEGERGREPTLAEIAEELGVSPREITWIIERGKSTFFISLEEEKEEGKRLIDGVSEERLTFNPEALLENAEMLNYLGKAIEELPERERLIITLYYFEGLTLKEIGTILEINESRVSQLISRTLLKLKAKLSDWK